MSAREGLLEPAFCALRIKKISCSEGCALWACIRSAGSGGLGKVSRDVRRRGVILRIISRGGMNGCSLKMASDPLKADLDLRGKSGGDEYSKGNSARTEGSCRIL